MTTEGAVERSRLDSPGDGPAPVPRAQPRVLRWLAAVAVLVIAGVVAAALLRSYPGRLGPDPTFSSPHENVRYHLAQAWLRTGRPVLDLPAYQRLPADVAPALTPRDASLLDGKVVPKDYPYALALVAGLAWIDPRLAMLLTVASAVAVLLISALLAWELTRSAAAAVVAAALVAASRAFVAAGDGLVETGATTALAVLAGLLAVLRARRGLAAEPVRRPLAALLGGDRGLPAGPVPGSALLLEGLAGACLGLAVGLHYAAALLAGPALLVAGLPAFGGGRRRRLALAAGFLVGLAPMLAFHAWLYGSPLATGYSVGSRFFDDNFQVHSADLFDLQPRLLARQVWFYWFRPEVLVLLAAATAGLAAGGWRRRPFLALVVVGVLGGGPYLAFTGARPLWGSGEYQFNASFLRYGLPVLTLVVVLAVAAAAWLRRLPARVVAVAAAGLLLAFGATSALHSLRSLRPEIGAGAATRQAVLAATGPAGLVVTARGDKWIWPERGVVTAAYLVRTPSQGRLGEHVYDTVPDRERLADVLVRLVKRGEETYLWNDGWLRMPDPRLDAMTERRGVYRHPTAVPSLFRYTSIPEPVRVSPRATR